MMKRVRPRVVRQLKLQYCRFSVTPYQMMNVSFAQSMRKQFANSYKRDGPAEIVPGFGIMNYQLTDSKKE